MACEFIITSDREFFEKIGEEETKRYFQTAYDFVANYKNLGKKYILSAKVHMDESTPLIYVLYIGLLHLNIFANIHPTNLCFIYWSTSFKYICKHL